MRGKLVRAETTRQFLSTRYGRHEPNICCEIVIYGAYTLHGVGCFTTERSERWRGEICYFNIVVKWVYCYFLQAAEAEIIPGNAALQYQKLLQDSASRQQKELEDDSSVTVDAASDAAPKSAAAETSKPAADDAEAKPDSEETGTK